MFVMYCSRENQVTNNMCSKIPIWEAWMEEVCAESNSMTQKVHRKYHRD